LNSRDSGDRVVKAVHGLKTTEPDPEYELELSRHLHKTYDRPGLEELYRRFAQGEGWLDRLMRRAIWRAVAKRFGQGIDLGTGLSFKHLETFEIGDGTFIGDQACLQGRYDGRCLIGRRVWIGPQSYLDARDLVIEDEVGWGPGAKVLGSAHTGIPVDTPIIRTDLSIRPVRIETGADIGTNAVILPGVTVGRGAIVGAGSVVRENVPPLAVVAGVPAKLIKMRVADDPTD